MALLLSYALIPCDVPDEMVAPLDRGSLPRVWRASPAPAALQRLGDEWVASMRSVALEVPSAIVEVENNVLLNPAHPDFGKVVIGDAIGFAYDVRLV